MAEPYLGEIRMFAGSFAPREWAFCDGQLLAISQFDALFSLFGTIYGGDGRTTFALPDLRGRIPIHQGQGPGLSDRRIGSKGGSQTETLVAAQLPSHRHSMQASSDVANVPNPAIHVVARSTSICHWIDEAPTAAMSSDAITKTGGSQSHENIAPYQCVSYIVSLFGLYPSRSGLIASRGEPAEGGTRV